MLRKPLESNKNQMSQISTNSNTHTPITHQSFRPFLRVEHIFQLGHILKKKKKKNPHYKTVFAYGFDHSKAYNTARCVQTARSIREKG